MSLILVGLNHQTAPVEVREQVYLSGEGLSNALVRLQEGGLSQVAILSTCNRLEVYAWVEDTEAGFRVISDDLGARLPSREHLAAHLYCLEGQSAVAHLMRVASGLESLVLGETQILGQVALALAAARDAGTVGSHVSRLFTAALRAGKRARSETGVSRYTVSVSGAAVALARRHIGDLDGVRSLVIGAGDMAGLAARALRTHGVKQITIANRTDAKAATLAKRLDAAVLPWDDLLDSLHEFDVVMAATSTQQPIIRLGDLLPLWGGRTALWIDLGVPRNIDPQTAELPGLLLYDIDDLGAVVDDHRARRRGETADVEALIAEEAEAYRAWLKGRAVAPLIGQLRGEAEAMARAEVEAALRRLPELDTHGQEIVRQMAHRIVSKLLHSPTLALKERAAYAGHADYAHAVRQLFALTDGDA